MLLVLIMSDIITLYRTELFHSVEHQLVTMLYNQQHDTWISGFPLVISTELLVDNKLDKQRTTDKLLSGAAHTTDNFLSCEANMHEIHQTSNS